MISKKSKSKRKMRPYPKDLPLLIRTNVEELPAPDGKEPYKSKIDKIYREYGWKTKEFCKDLSDFLGLDKDKEYDDKKYDTIRRFRDGSRAISGRFYYEFCEFLGLDWEDYGEESDNKSSKISYEKLDGEINQISPNVPYNNLPRLTNDFTLVGRDNFLITLHECLQPSSEDKASVVCQITGLPGVGKSALALYYAYQHLNNDDYPGGVCWLRASDVNGLEFYLKQFAENAWGLNSSDRSWAWCMRQQNKPTLFIIDDFDDSDWELLTRGGNPYFRFLITTRKNLDVLQNTIVLSPPEAEDSQRILLNIVGDDDSRIGEENLPLVARICSQLGYLPLSITLVGYHLRRLKNRSLISVLQQLESVDVSLKIGYLQKSNLDSVAKRGVLAAFDMSWQRLTPEVKRFAVLLSLFHYSPVPWDFLETVIDDPWDCLDSLEGFHLAHLKEDGTVERDQTVYAFIGTKISTINDAEHLKCRMCCAVLDAFVDLPDAVLDIREEDVQPVILHALNMVDNYQDYIPDGRYLLIAKTYIYLGRDVFDKGDFNKADQYYEKALNICLNYDECNAQLLAELYMLKAVLCREKGKEGDDLQKEKFYRKAINNVDMSLAMYDQKLGFKDDNTYVLNARIARATIQLELGKPDDALGKELSKLYTLRLRNSGTEEHPDVTEMLNILAVFYERKGEYEQSIKRHLKAIEINEQVLGRDDPHTATSYANLAKVYGLQNNLELAINNYETAKEIFDAIDYSQYGDFCQARITELLTDE